MQADAQHSALGGSMVRIPAPISFSQSAFRVSFVEGPDGVNFFVVVVCRFFVCRRRVALKRKVSELRSLDYTNFSQIYNRNSPASKTFEFVQMKNREIRSSSLNYPNRQRFEPKLSISWKFVPLIPCSESVRFTETSLKMKSCSTFSHEPE